MAKLPHISGDNLLKIFTKHFGFRSLRQKGSHLTLTNDKVFTTIPLHPVLDIGTLDAILREAGVNHKDFLKYV